MAFPDGWSYRWPIAINADSVITSPVSSWPCLITDVHFPDDAWEHMNADASDLRFSSDEDGKSELYYDAPRISVSGKSAHLYVQVPTLSSTGDTTIYAWVGNPIATAPSAAWMQSTYPADWAAFWPMEEGTGTTVGDRTSNGRHGTAGAAVSWVQSADGSWYLSFVDGVITTTWNGILGNNARSVLVRANLGLAALTDSLVAWGSNIAGGRFDFWVLSGGLRTEVHSGYRQSATNLAGNVWRSLGTTMPNGGSVDDILLYHNGAALTDITTLDRPVNTVADVGVQMGRHVKGSASGSLVGDLASTAILSRMVSADEVKVHHAQFTPATWASAGELAAVGGGAVRRAWANPGIGPHIGPWLTL